jgi:hypothetical protein
MTTGRPDPIECPQCRKLRWQLCDIAAIAEHRACVLCYQLESDIDNDSVGVWIKSFDQATKSTGVAISYNGVVHAVRLITTDGIEEMRRKIWLEVGITPRPALLVFEDTYSRYRKTHKALARLLGACEMAADHFHMEYHAIHPQTADSICGLDWRKTKEKRMTQVRRFAKDLYGDVPDDVASAIVLGYAGYILHTRKEKQNDG